MTRPLRKVGKILHRSNLARNILIVKLRERVPLGVVIFDDSLEEVGKVIEIFGPVRSPYARVLVEDKMLERVDQMKGIDCFVVEGEEEKVKWRKMPRPRKGRVS